MKYSLSVYGLDKNLEIIEDTKIPIAEGSEQAQMSVLLWVVYPGEVRRKLKSRGYLENFDIHGVAARVMDIEHNWVVEEQRMAFAKEEQRND